MALRLAGEEISVQEVVETITYVPDLASSGDLEPATRTITATAKPGVADYSADLTLPAPSDPRLRVLRLGLRLQVTIDSFGGVPAATQLSYAVHVNGTERLTGTWTATGDGLAAVDLTEGQFDLGTANTIAVYLWVDQGEAVVSLAQAWLAVGTCNTSYTEIVKMSHRGLAAATVYVQLVGTGTPTTLFGQQTWHALAQSTGVGHLPLPSFVANDPVVACNGTVGADLNYVLAVTITLRSVQ